MQIENKYMQHTHSNNQSCGGLKVNISSKSDLNYKSNQGEHKNAIQELDSTKPFQCIEWKSKFNKT